MGNDFKDSMDTDKFHSLKDAPDKFKGKRCLRCDKKQHSFNKSKWCCACEIIRTKEGLSNTARGEVHRVPKHTKPLTDKEKKLKNEQISKKDS